MIKCWGDMRFEILNPCRTGLKYWPHFFRVRIARLGSRTCGVTSICHSQKLSTALAIRPPVPDTMLTLLLAFLLVGEAHVENVDAAFAGQGRVFVSTPVSNFPKRSVFECMSPIPKDHVLTPEMSVEDTMGVLLQNGLTGAPVVNQERLVVGMVSSFDFLQKEAFEGALLPMEGSAANVEKYVEAAKKICGQSVFDVMTPNPRTISPNRPMREAAAMMTAERLHHLPVVDDEGRLVGVLTTADVMRDLHHIVRNLPESKEDEGQPSTKDS
jgi:CBS domain-containing protein